jgi:hypothetical protein
MNEKLNQLINKILNPTITITWCSIGIGINVLFGHQLPKNIDVLISVCVIVFSLLMMINETVKYLKKK